MSLGTTKRLKPKTGADFSVFSMDWRTPTFADPESAVLPLDDVPRLNIAKITEERRRAQGRYSRTVPVRSHRVFVKKWVATEAAWSSHSRTVNSCEYGSSSYDQ